MDSSHSTKSPAAAAPRAGGARRALFGLAAVLLVPLVLLLALEGSLRLTGVGFDPSFFAERKIGGERVLTDNPRFSWRFFPPAVARGAPSFVLPREKPEGTVRVFCLGGSAAMGDPSPGFGLPRILQAMLEKCRLDLGFEVVNAAMPAINSYGVLPIARDCLAQDPDLLVVYLGNNEVVGPFGVGSVFGVPGAGIRLARAQLWAKSLRLGQLLERFLGSVLRRRSAPESWEGLAFFVGNEIAHDDPRLATVHESFRHNLADLCDAALSRDVPVVLSTVGVNLRDCAPFASRPGDDHAETLFRQGRALELAGEYEAACARYEAARDADALRFRADSGIDAVIRHVAAARAGQGVRLVDAAAALGRAAPHGIPGAESFDDHVHLTFVGNYELAKALVAEILPLLPASSDSAIAATRIPDRDACAARLGYTPVDRQATVETMRLRRLRAPFTGGSDQKEWRVRVETSLDSLAAYERPHYVRKALAEKERALRDHPGDGTLRRGVAELLARTGDWAGSTRENRRLVEQLPHSSDAHYALGASLQRLGHPEEAAVEFERAIELFAGHFLAHAGLGEMLLERGEAAAALPHFEEAVRRHPRFAAAHRARGDALLALGRVDKAIAAFEQAVEVNPALAGAHKRLGDALVAAGNPALAIGAYRQAVQVHPGYAGAHEALGDAYRLLERNREATRHFEQALAIRPESADLRRKLAEVEGAP